MYEWSMGEPVNIEIITPIEILKIK
jgi:hypothetical protein